MLAHGALKFPAYCLYLLIVGVVNASLSRSFGGFDMPLLNLFIAYLIITDAVSVIAHMQRLGIPVPDLLRRVLLRSKRKVERRVDGPTGIKMDQSFSGYFNDNADNASVVVTLVNDVESY